MIEAVEDLLQERRIESRSLPELRRRRLEERMRIPRVTLRVLGRRDIQAEPRADQRPMRVRVGIGGEHPAFMPLVTKDIHQGLQMELDVRVLKFEQRWRRGQ